MKREILCLGVFALLLHIQNLQNDIVWDDRVAVALNRDLQLTTPVTNLWCHDYWGQPMAAVDSHKSWRPLATLTFRWNYAIHSLHPAGYHFVNVLINAISCCLVLVLGRQFFGDARIATLAAIAFAVHPIHTEAIACIVGRADLLCGLFFLSAVHFHVAAGSLLHASSAEHVWRCVLFSFLAYVFAAAASLSKEIGLTCFPLLTVLEIIPLLCNVQVLSRSSMIGKNTTRFIVRVSCDRSFYVRCVVAQVGALSMAFLHVARHGEEVFYKWTFLENSIASSLDDLPLPRILSYAQTHALYFSKLVFPLHLCYDYGHPCIGHIASVLDIRNFLPVVLYAICAVISLLGVHYRSQKVLIIVALAMLPFVPASQIFFPIGTILGERLLYLPSVGVCFGFAASFYALDTPADRVLFERYMCANWHGMIGRRFTLRRWALYFLPSPRFIRVMRQATAGALILGAVIRTLSRNDEWLSERVLFESSMDVCPLSLKVLNNLALVLSQTPRQGQSPDLLRARQLLDIAIEGAPTFHAARYNRGLVRHLDGRLVAAVHEFKISSDLRTHDERLNMHLGQELWLLSKYVLQNALLNAVAARSALLEASNFYLVKGEHCPRTMWVRASIAFEQENYGTAAVLVTSSLRTLLLKRVSDASDLETGPLVNLLGLAQRGLGDDRAALRIFQLGLHNAPESFELHSNAAALLSDKTARYWE
mmetsp:Transcript_23264/g.71571  ORF Transcript_23264/g.71571 Transcript_23264/m.71571 type:complete len:706 (-) Transcript_23264:438-2555(-)